jgi:uncharacterized protein (TIGR03067 family)
VTNNDRYQWKGTYLTDTIAVPRQINFTIAYHSDSQAVGSSWQGIYKFRGDSLWVCASYPGAGIRPAFFDTLLFVTYAFVKN